MVSGNSLNIGKQNFSRKLNIITQLPTSYINANAWLSLSFFSVPLVHSLGFQSICDKKGASNDSSL